MRKLALGLTIAPLGYFVCAAILRDVVFRETPIPAAAYPPPGAVYSSEIEGVDSQIIREEAGHDLKRVRVRPGAPGTPRRPRRDVSRTRR
jgi:hypothetical protein